jgi:GcrA cell cycle regulator
MDWTDERVAELKRLWLEGQSASQVARQLGGVSRNAVIGKVHRMGLAGRDLPSTPRALGGLSPSRGKSSAVANSVRRRAVRPSQPSAPRAPRIELTATATLLTLTPNGCRWPIGDPQEAGFGFCGRLKADQASYCRHHAQTAVRRPMVCTPGQSAPGPRLASARG